MEVKLTLFTKFLLVSPLSLSLSLSLSLQYSKRDFVDKREPFSDSMISYLKLKTIPHFMYGATSKRIGSLGCGKYHKWGRGGI